MTSELLNGEPLRILLVEDDPAHAELITRCFEEHNIANRIYHVGDGETALDFLHHRGDYADQEASPRPHVILLDLRLPGICGLDVLTQVKTNEDLETIPVVILTASQAEPDIEEAYKKRVNSYLVKPLDFDKFKQLMIDLGFYWLGWNRSPWS